MSNFSFKFLYLAILIFLVISACSTNNNTPLKGLLFVANDSINLGTVKIKDSIPILFELKNNGKENLKLKAAGSSCECSDVTLVDSIIKPSSKTNVSVLFFSNTEGDFKKTIVVETDGDPIYKVLYFYGTLIK